ncbi:hypothetical protein BTA51_13450 [Hahella sp. CCB-MM4]|uniref:type VI secretion system Vgr family protein n=1 Tax=Hahella sp. (strain CCB-MM4) TaxID=1926491 RepID=UPI000B9BFA37|nr:type VI secretion system tip protein TssI/VgrG [Hahella sp. CCB-MM4]OZG72959.1 hypothetical protein BTA51_13450 [Hahella sp. CCB-MM4]
MGASIFQAGIYTQDSRSIRIDTPLGKDALLLRHFSGQEGYSQLFHYEVDLLSPKGDIKPEDIVGEYVNVTVEATTESPRLFSGYINYFEYTGLEKRGLYGYKATLVPWLWFLSKRTNCRVFQNQTVPQILTAVFDELGFTDYNFSGLSSKHPPLEYCVQYRESDLDFVLRLLEQEGIYFHFEQADDKHTLMLSDDKSSYAPLAPNTILHSSGTREGRHILQWRHSFQYYSGKWSLNDFNFEKFGQSLESGLPSVRSFKNNQNYERYDYPGSYESIERGRELTKLRMEQEESGFAKAGGKSNVTTFGIGRKFTLLSDECAADSKKKFVITGLYHQASESSYLDNGEDENKDDDLYFNQFECIPEDVNFRAPLHTPKPRIDGVQTAIVCGKLGDEIYTDEYGRIKIQFHWDRYGEKDENSSCWVRVATTSAGKKWGSVSLPRVGQEVVVTFLEGDPDRPLVIGSVYNISNMPPFSLPGDKTKSGYKSRSSKSGQASNYNEIVFDDKKGEESLSIHAEKDFNMNVKNNLGASTKGNASTSVVGNSSDSVDGNSSLTVGGDHSVSVTGKQNITVSGTQTQAVTGKQTLNVSADQEESISGNITQSATNHTVSLSADHTLNATNQKISLGSAQEVSASSQKFTISGLQNVQADAQTVNVTGKTSTTATDIALSAGSKISLAVGGTSIQIDGGGVTITLGASSVKVDATGVSVSGPMIKLN